MYSWSNMRLKKACGIILPKMKFKHNRQQTICGRRQYDDHDGRDTSEEFVFAHEECWRVHSGGKQVSNTQRNSTVVRAGKSCESASIEAVGYQSGCAAQSAIASWGIYRADDGRAHRSEDGRDGQISCWSALIVWRGGVDGDDRSHEHRGFSEHSWAGGGRGVKQNHRAVCGKRRVHWNQVMFLGYNGAGSSDMPSDGSWASAKDQRATHRNRKTDQERHCIEDREAQREGGGDLHGDQTVHSREEREDDRAEEKTWEKAAPYGLEDVAIGGGFHGRHEHDGESSIRGGTGLVSQDARSDQNMDEDGVSSFGKDHQFVVSRCASDHAWKSGAGGGVWQAMDYHITHGWIHHRASVQESRERYGWENCERGVAAVQGCTGRDAGYVRLRSRRRRKNEPQTFETGEGSEELHLSKGQGEDGCWADNLYICEARAGPFRGGDRNDQVREVQFQQAACEVRGIVCHEGADGNIGGKCDPVATGFKRKCSDSGDGVMKGMRKDRSKGYGDGGKMSGLPEKETLNPKYVFLTTISPTDST